MVVKPEKINSLYLYSVAMGFAGNRQLRLITPTFKR